MNLMTTFFNKLASTKFLHNDNYLRLTGAFSFGMFSGLQALSISKNKNVPDDTKKFMVAQELTESLMKIAVFLVCAKGFGFIGESLVKSGRVLPKEIIEKYSLNTVKEAGKFAKGVLENLPKSTKETVNVINKTVNFEDAKILKNFHDGLATVTNIVGMITGLSIIVPPCRNFIASQFKTKSTHAEKPAPATRLNITENSAPKINSLLQEYNRPQLKPPAINPSNLAKPNTLNKQPAFGTFAKFNI